MKATGTEVEDLPDGFRRTGAAPEPIRWSGLRDRLSDAAGGHSGAAQAVRDGLAVFRSWDNLGALAPALLPAGCLRDTATSRRALQRALRMVGTPPVSLGDLASHPRGAPARIRGRILRARRKLLSHIWFKGKTSGTNVRLFFEEGHDFFLTDRAGQIVLIMAAGGYLMGAADATLDTGDWVEVFGFVDRVIQGESPRGASHRRGEPLILALCSGDALPIVVWKTPAEPA